LLLLLLSPSLDFFFVVATAAGVAVVSSLFPSLLLLLLADGFRGLSLCILIEVIVLFFVILFWMVADNRFALWSDFSGKEFSKKWCQPKSYRKSFSLRLI